MEKRGAMFARRTLAYQFGIFAQKPLQCPQVSGDDGVGSLLELRYSRAISRKLLDMFGQPGPTDEAVGTGNHKLGVSQGAFAFLREQLPRGEFVYLVDPSSIFHGKMGNDCQPAQAHEITDPLRHPLV